MSQDTALLEEVGHPRKGLDQAWGNCGHDMLRGVGST